MWRMSQGGLMSNNSDGSKLVGLEQKLPNESSGLDRVGALIKQCRGIAQTRLTLMLAAVFDNADDSLFELAKKAEGGSDQKRYFDSMRALRLKRQQSERLFFEQLTRNFLHMGGPDSARDEAPKATLALLDDKDMEETLALSSMIEKGNNQLVHHLKVLEQRLSVLVGGNRVEPKENPLGPQALSEAFHASLAEHELDVGAKLLILKIFDKHVIGALDILYEEINEHLVKAGVLPYLKFPKAVRSDSAEQTKKAEAQRPTGDVFEQAAVAEAELRIEVYRTVRSLLSTRRLMSGNHVQPAGPSFATGDLVNALSLLQCQAAAMTTPVGQEASELLVPMIQLKQDLVAHLLGMDPDVKHGHVAEVDEDTIDLVGMLFEFVLQDRNLPSRLQALLARLQIPYLKCAILDKDLFAQKEHPARQLLDELAQAGLSWTEEGDKDGRFIRKVQSIVESLLTDFSEDIQIFERQLEGFREFNRTVQRRAEVVELRAAETAQGAERLQSARHSAAAEMVRRVDGKSLPDVIRYLLTRPWANVLVLTALRQGLDSAAWKSALRVADALVWSAQSKTTEADKARLRTMVPELDRALRQGLVMVAFHEKDLQQLMTDLHAFYEQQYANTPVPVVEPEVSGAAALSTGYTPSAADGAVVAPEPSFVEELIRAVPAAAADVASEDEFRDEFYKAASAIKIGLWIEFGREDGHAERAKLSWISPISHKYLFVNRKGLKVADKTVLALAYELRHGRAIVLEDVPLFDRALDAIVEKLKALGDEVESSVTAAA